MRELTSTETEHAAGGIAVSGAIGLGIGTSLVGAYIYEKLGGAKGIEEKVKAAFNGLVESAKDQTGTCQKAPAACLG